MIPLGGPRDGDVPGSASRQRMLGSLGLAPEHEAVYRALAGRVRAGLTELGEILQVPTPEIEHVLSSLVRDGLVQPFGE